MCGSHPLSLKNVMKLLLDFFPVLAFFITFKWLGIYPATAVLIVGSLIQTLGHWLIKKEFEKLHLITLAASVILGGMTLAFQDDRFIKWKVSVIYWIFSLVIIGFWLFKKQIAIQKLFEGLLKMELGIAPSFWHKVNLSWLVVFIVMGLVNLWIAYSFELDVWVNFKVWGIMIIQMVLMLATFAFVFNAMPEDKRNALTENDSKESSTSSNSTEKQD